MATVSLHQLWTNFYQMGKRMNRTRMTAKCYQHEAAIGRKELTNNTTIFRPTCQGVKATGGTENGQQRTDD